MGALDQLRAATSDGGLVTRARSNPRLIVAIAGGILLLIAWIGWAIYVTSDQGARAGLGVVIAWPAMLAALAIVSLPFIAGYLLIRRLSSPEGEQAAFAEAEPDGEEDSEDEPEDEDAEESGDDDDQEEDSEEESDSEAEASSKS